MDSLCCVWGLLPGGGGGSVQSMPPACLPACCLSVQVCRSPERDTILLFGGFHSFLKLKVGAGRGWGWVGAGIGVGDAGLPLPQ